MKVGEWLAQASERLSSFPTPDADARLLLEHVMGLRPLPRQDDVTDLDLANSLLDRRLQGEPVQYITGEAPFRYLVLDVGPGVLIPRPETELLVDAALKLMETQARVADFGAGSGAISIAIATESDARVVAVEKDPAACKWLRRNVEKYNAKVDTMLADVSTVILSDLDIVIANPPYVPNSISLPAEIVDHEPEVAIFGGHDGTEVPRTFLNAAHRALRSGGFVILEHSDSHQERIVEIAEELFVDVAAHCDLVGRPRFITARKS